MEILGKLDGVVATSIALTFAAHSRLSGGRQGCQGILDGQFHHWSQKCDDSKQ
jgi:hypothetical protein